MSIYKEKQRDEVALLEIVMGWFGAKCKSYIKPPFAEHKHVCWLRLGHPNKHDDQLGNKWSYGDDLFDVRERVGYFRNLLLR